MRILVLLIMGLAINGCTKYADGKFEVSELNNKRYFIPTDCVSAEHNDTNETSVSCLDEKGKVISSLSPVTDKEYEEHLSDLKTAEMLNGIGHAMSSLANGYNQGRSSSYVPSSYSYQQPRYESVEPQERESYFSKKESKGKYESHSDKKYQYDLSNPHDSLQYSVDTEAQMRDLREAPHDKLYDYMDSGYGQSGGGVYSD